MMPSFLWSTVNNHARQPVVVTGRFNAPRAVEGTAGADACNSLIAVVGRSMMAMLFSDYFNVRR
jgi:hypothetical protein